jgi:hypothetical protein
LELITDGRSDASVTDIAGEFGEPAEVTGMKEL